MTVRHQVEVRSKFEGNKLVGHAAVFDQVTRVPGNYESISRSAFDAILDDENSDTRALINHDPNLLIGRQSAGTLRYGVDKEGLEFEVDLPDTSYVRDLKVLAERGDITGASFGFVPGEDEWEKMEDGGRLRRHTLIRALADVSIVTFPAYDGAQANIRSEQTDFKSVNRRRLVRVRANKL